MSLPSCREIRNQVLVLVGTAAVVLAATTVVTHQPRAAVAPAPIAENVVVESEAVAVESSVNWNDVNLSSGQGPSPEGEVTTARSKMLSDFEAR